MVVAVCACGARYILSGEGYPRPVACHRCGSRVTVSGPGEVAGEGWQVLDGEEAEPPAEAAWRSGVSGCLVCGRAAWGACPHCGGFFCPVHGGGRSFGGASCVRCYDGRPLMIVGAVVATVAGLFLLRAPFTFSEQVRNDPRFESTIVFLVAMAAGLFLVAGVILWGAFRRFP
jgi:hypothetical protein